LVVDKIPWRWEDFQDLHDEVHGWASGFALMP